MKKPNQKQNDAEIKKLKEIRKKDKCTTRNQMDEVAKIKSILSDTMLMEDVAEKASIVKGSVQYSERLTLINDYSTTVLEKIKEAN